MFSCYSIKSAFLTLTVVQVTITEGLQTGIQVQLKDGIFGNNEGRVLISVGKPKQDTNEAEWGFICDDVFHGNTAKVICSQLGYNYGVHQRNTIYGSARLQEGFLLNNVKCNGTESNIGDCNHGKIEQTTCISARAKYAGVCCSNQSEFGEWDGSLFIGHCSVPWSDAADRCETLGLSLYTPDTVQTENLESLGGREVWVGEFYSRWISAMGCYGLRSYLGDIGNVSYMVEPSPAACAEFCPSGPEVSSGYMGKDCVCLTSTSTLQRIEPVCCQTTRRKRSIRSKNKRNRTRRNRGGGHSSVCTFPNATLQLFKAVSSEDFTMHKTPDGISQCAIMSSIDRHLMSEDCEERHRLVCQTVEGEARVLQSKKINYSEAYSRCYNNILRLATRNVQQLNDVDVEGDIWVDVTRHVLAVSATGKSRNFSKEKRICVSMATKGRTRSYIDCVEAKPYVCVKPDSGVAVTSSEGNEIMSSPTTDLLGTDQPSTNKVQFTPTPSLNVPQGPRAEESTVVYVIIVCTVLILIALVTMGIICLKRSFNRGSKFYTSSSEAAKSETMATDIDLNQNGFVENPKEEEESEHYEEIPFDMVPDQLEDAIEDIRLKQYYDSPIDALKGSKIKISSKKSLKSTKSSASYKYPYDSLDLKALQTTSEENGYAVCATPMEKREEETEM